MYCNDKMKKIEAVDLIGQNGLKEIEANIIYHSCELSLEKQRESHLPLNCTQQQTIDNLYCEILLMH